MCSFGASFYIVLVYGGECGMISDKKGHAMVLCFLPGRLATWFQTVAVPQFLALRNEHRPFITYSGSGLQSSDFSSWVGYQRTRAWKGTRSFSHISANSSAQKHILGKRSDIVFCIQNCLRSGWKHLLILAVSWLEHISSCEAGWTPVSLQVACVSLGNIIQLSWGWVALSVLSLLMTVSNELSFSVLITAVPLTCGIRVSVSVSALTHVMGVTRFTNDHT